MAEQREQQADERTQQPTPLRLREARERGQVPRSAELTSAAALLGALLGLALLGGGLLADLTDMTRALLAAPGAAPSDGVLEAAGPAVLRVGAILAIIAAAAAGTGLVQTGGVVSAARIRPDVARLSPSGGLRRLLSARMAARTARALGKVALITAVTYGVLGPLLGRLAAAGEMRVAVLTAELGRLAGQLALRIAVALLALAALDYAYQRWQHRRDLRMTRRDWLDNMRKTEGDPHLRRRRRRKALELSRGRAAGRRETKTNP